MKSHLVPFNMRMPADVLADLKAVCGERARSKFIIAAVRQKLANEPAVQRAQEAREAAIAEKAITEEQLTPEEAAHWNHTRIEQAPTTEVPLVGRVIKRGDELVVVDHDGLTSSERKAAEARRTADAVGEGLGWDPDRIDGYIARGPLNDVRLALIELNEERKNDA